MFQEYYRQRILTDTLRCSVFAGVGAGDAAGRAGAHPAPALHLQAGGPGGRGRGLHLRPQTNHPRTTGSTIRRLPSDDGSHPTPRTIPRIPEPGQNNFGFRPPPPGSPGTVRFTPSPLDPWLHGHGGGGDGYTTPAATLR
eukprot:1183546-Prorocentrum_minimum.AAC.1